MRLARLGDAGREVPVGHDGGGWRDLRPVLEDLGLADLGGAAFAPDALGRIRSALDAGDLPRVGDGGRTGSPVARPGAIVCIGQNYAAHAAESNSPPPEWPIVFFKSPSSLCGPDDDLVLPPRADTTDWEAELALVIGTRAWQLDSPTDARRHVAGFLVADDVSERTWQRAESGGQWGKGKSAPGFCSLGPEVVTADAVEPSALRIWSRVNGDARQDSTTADLIFDVDVLVHHLSHYLALEPGDLVLTGTPQGVAMSGRFPYLAAGDTLEIGVDGLGTQTRRVVATEGG